MRCVDHGERQRRGIWGETTYWETGGGGDDGLAESGSGRQTRDACPRAPHGRVQSRAPRPSPQLVLHLPSPATRHSLHFPVHPSPLLSPHLPRIKTPAGDHFVSSSGNNIPLSAPRLLRTHVCRYPGLDTFRNDHRCASANSCRSTESRAGSAFALCGP